MVRSKYDTVEDKYMRSASSSHVKIRKNPLNTFQFMGSSFQRSRRRINSELPRKYLVSPASLAFLAAIKVDQLKTPKPMYWTAHCVKKYIVQLGFPQYTNSFEKNLVSGRILLLVDASALVKMNITNFEHMKIISRQIQKLYEFESIRFSRSISLPLRYPLTHKTLYTRLTGPRYNCCRASDLFQKMKLIDLSFDTVDHWTRLEKWLRHEGDANVKRIGYAPRCNLYKYEKLPMHLENSKRYILCECIPPCECAWSEKDTESPKTLSCLVDLQQVENVPSEPPGTRPHRMSSFHVDCWCEPGTWMHNHENVLSILKTAMPKKYNTRVVVKV